MNEPRHIGVILRSMDVLHDCAQCGQPDAVKLTDEGEWLCVACHERKEARTPLGHAGLTEPLKATVSE